MNDDAFGNEDKEDEAFISIRVTIHRKSRFIETGFKIKKKYWNDNAREINHRHPNSVEWNAAINAMIDKCNELLALYRKRNEIPSHEDFKKYLIPEQAKSQCLLGNDFIKFYEQCIQFNPNAEEKSKENYRKCIPHLRMVHPYPTFQDINRDFILAFEQAMRECRLMPGTRYRRHKYLKPVLEECVEEDYISTNPYQHKTIKNLLKKLGQEAKTPKVVLTGEEIRRIEQLSFTPDHRHLEIVRDMFLFACFSAMRLYDFTHFEKRWLTIKGKEMYLTYKPSKKGSRLVNAVPLHQLFEGKPMRLVLKYIGNDTEFVFPVRSEKDINVPLKEIAERANIDKVISSHVGRYTFCTMMAQKVTPEILIKYTGHARSTTLSEFYVHIDSKMRDEAYNASIQPKSGANEDQ
ncbi:MAG: phage integrase SAM-like domain-containing protein [Bacteroidota bacterium]